MERREGYQIPGYQIVFVTKTVQTDVLKGPAPKAQQQ